VQIVGEKRRSSRHGGHRGSNISQHMGSFKRPRRSQGVRLPHDILREKGRELSLRVQQKQATLAFQVRSAVRYHFKYKLTLNETLLPGNDQGDSRSLGYHVPSLPRRITTLERTTLLALNLAASISAVSYKTQCVSHHHKASFLIGFLQVRAALDSSESDRGIYLTPCWCIHQGCPVAPAVVDKVRITLMWPCTKRALAPNLLCFL
jgi:hypothetical protein